MPIKSGEKAYVEWMGITEVKIVKYLPNSHRYKIMQEGTWERVIAESKVYPTRVSLLEKQLDFAKGQIEHYTKEKEKLEQELGVAN